MSDVLFEITTSLDEEEEDSNNFDAELQKGPEANNELRMSLVTVNDSEEKNSFLRSSIIPIRRLHAGKKKESYGFCRSRQKIMIGPMKCIRCNREEVVDKTTGTFFRNDRDIACIQNEMLGKRGRIRLFGFIKE